ncbi:MAG: polymer-forming cytoskeletal protein [Bacteroidetes bacterium]|nr:polymer-forming cytoskeletal protein [Bacteroidota bacterium]
MFSKKNKIELDQQAIATFISEGCVFDGSIKAPAFVRIEGQINGDVTVDEGLILGEKGTITGNIVTKEIIVYGAVNGNISTHSLEIKATGRITGDIKTQVLQVETGGMHNGKLSMSANTANSHSTKQIKAEAVTA